MAYDHSHDENFIEEQLHTHKWLRRFVVIGPTLTAPVFLIPTHLWIGDEFHGQLLIGFYFFLVFMTTFSYVTTAFTSAGRVPRGWTPNEKTTYIYPENDTGQIPVERYCSHCEAYKPPRAAHCKFCARCVPKMDHHCVWTANCVGEKNHKVFCQFLFYMATMSGVFLATTLFRVIKIILHSSDDAYAGHMGPGQVMLTVIGVMFGLPTNVGTGSLLIVQMVGICQNMTVLEKKQFKNLKKLIADTGVDNDSSWKLFRPFDQGAVRNFVAVFGSNPIDWFIPTLISRKKDNEIIDWPLNPKFSPPKLKRVDL